LPEENADTILEITAYIANYHPPSLDFSLNDGVVREMRLEGHIDDPYQAPSGEIFENEAGSKFSNAPIVIKVFQDDLHVKRIKNHDAKAIGVLAVRQNVEVTTFHLLGDEHIDHPVRVTLNVSENIFNLVANILELNAIHKKLGYISFRVKISRNQLRGLNQDDGIHGYPRLSDLDVSKGLTVPVMGFCFGQTIFDRENATQSSRVKTLESRQTGSDVAVSLNKASWSFNAQTGDYDRIELEGNAKKDRYSFKSDKIDVAIDLKRFWWFTSEFIDKNKLPEQCEYGRYHYSADTKFLSLDLAYHPEDLEHVFKPILFSNKADEYRILISFDENLKFDKDQEGIVQSYKIRRDSENIGKANESNADAEISLADIDYKLSAFIQTSEQRFSEFDLSIKKAGSSNFQNNLEIKKQLEAPTDILSRIALKIPIIGPILRFLAR
jgi:hypothetical protein